MGVMSDDVFGLGKVNLLSKYRRWERKVNLMSLANLIVMSPNQIRKPPINNIWNRNIIIINNKKKNHMFGNF